MKIQKNKVSPIMKLIKDYESSLKNQVKSLLTFQKHLQNQKSNRNHEDDEEHNWEGKLREKDYVK